MFSPAPFNFVFFFFLITKKKKKKKANAVNRTLNNYCQMLNLDRVHPQRTLVRSWTTSNTYVLANSNCCSTSKVVLFPWSIPDSSLRALCTITSCGAGKRFFFLLFICLLVVAFFTFATLRTHNIWKKNYHWLKGIYWINKTKINLYVCVCLFDVWGRCCCGGLRIMLVFQEGPSEPEEIHIQSIW